MNTGRKESLASTRPGRGGVSALGVGVAFQAHRLSLLSSGLAPSQGHSCAAVTALPFVF